MKITNEMVHNVYIYAKKVYNNEITKGEAKVEVNKITGMKVGSANDYITVFFAMIDGQEYHRTINSYATRYYLENIKKDFGQEVLKKAVFAVEKHVKYYNTLRNGKLSSIEELIKDFE